jgi:hypothetical protein
VTSTSIPGIGNTTNGVSVRGGANNSIAVSRDGDVAGYFNRNTSDGDIVQLRKDGTTVGSIGSRSSAHTYIALSSSGLANAGLSAGTASGSSTIFPTDSSGSTRDNGVDLGFALGRFKDLYLSGGVYLGGTGSANYLDDYEEGTFTVTTNSDPTGAISSEEGAYVKIGNLVIVRIAFTVSATFTNTTIAGLPFGGGGTIIPSSIGAVAPVQTSSTNGSPIIAHTSIGATNIAFSSGTGLTGHPPNTTNNTYRLTLSYISN